MYHLYSLFIYIIHPIISVRISQQYICYLYFSNINKTKERKLNQFNDKVIMLSHASKEHSPVVMMTNNCRVISQCIMMSANVCCLVMTLPIGLCYLVLSVNYFYWHYVFCAYLLVSCSSAL